jgi:predicted aconitase
MYKPLMSLTPEQEAILEGKEGETKAKMMECLVRYGDVFGAKRMAEVTHKEGHLVTSFGIPMLGTVYTTMDELISSGAIAKDGFTVDPRPYDFQNVKCNPIEKMIFSKIMYAKQDDYEKQLQKEGLVEKDAFSCTCYLPEMGNTPKEGDVLSWAESSAVVFANSVLGARCNRNSGILELFGSVLGYAPEFGFLTDEGRKATWKSRPQAHQAPRGPGLRERDRDESDGRSPLRRGARCLPQTIAR